MTSVAVSLEAPPAPAPEARPGAPAQCSCGGAAVPLPVPAVVSAGWVAAYLGATLAETRRLLVRGTIPGGRRLGRCWAVSRVVIEKWVYDGMPRTTPDRRAAVAAIPPRRPRRRR
ncbi:MAG: hypothetical protein L0216_01590 [Planctomycetales bacterium]|nr:hypothetical protein [Planctomycetales bacterium]